jgi:hypothetical protein
LIIRLIVRNNSCRICNKSKNKQTKRGRRINMIITFDFCIKIFKINTISYLYYIITIMNSIKNIKNYLGNTKKSYGKKFIIPLMVVLSGISSEAMSENKTDMLTDIY